MSKLRPGLLPLARHEADPLPRVPEEDVPHGRHDPPPDAEAAHRVVPGGVPRRPAGRGRAAAPGLLRNDLQSGLDLGPQASRAHEARDAVTRSHAALRPAALSGEIGAGRAPVGDLPWAVRVGGRGPRAHGLLRSPRRRGLERAHAPGRPPRKGQDAHGPRALRIGERQAPGRLPQRDGIPHEPPPGVPGRGRGGAPRPFRARRAPPLLCDPRPAASANATVLPARGPGRPSPGNELYVSVRSARRSRPRAAPGRAGARRGTAKAR